MASIRWGGSVYSAEPIEQLPNGNWRMKALEHGPRFSVGTILEMKQNEIIEIAAAEMPPDPAASAAALERAMAEERKTLPSVGELLVQKAAPAPEPTA